jgi:serine/threonine-protein kinase
VSVALQVCDSLAEAHERGLVHRDLKPANLFMARIGCDPHFVKVLDFGFAELIRRLRVAGDASTPATVRVAGTPAFMAPETLLEEEVDARADLYQLACTLFYLLTGHLVFERPSAVAMVLAQVHEPAPPVSTRTSQPIPPDLEAIIARCLEKQPKDRFRSAEALAVALRKVRFDSTLPRGQRSLPAIEHAWLG